MDHFELREIDRSLAPKWVVVDRPHFEDREFSFLGRLFQVIRNGEETQVYCVVRECVTDYVIYSAGCSGGGYSGFEEMLDGLHTDVFWHLEGTRSMLAPNGCLRMPAGRRYMIWLGLRSKVYQRREERKKDARRARRSLSQPPNDSAVETSDAGVHSAVETRNAPFHPAVETRVFGG